MGNMYKLKDAVKEFTQHKFNQVYGFDYWKHAVALEANAPNKSEMLHLFDMLGEKVKPLDATTKIQTSQNDWAPCCSVTYEWTFKAGTIQFSITLVRDEIQFVHLEDMLSISQQFGNDFDLAREFDKLVVIPSALRSN